MADELVQRATESIRERQFTTLLGEPRPGVYLFFSFDLVNSTQFKAVHPGDWQIVVTRFYELIENELITRFSSAIVWKFMGDEVLFFKQITAKPDLHRALPAAHAALLATMEVLHKNFPLSRELLAVKGTAWIAEARPIKPSDAFDIKPNSRNVIVETGRSPAAMRRDFLGPDIDIGFRISKFSLRRRLVVSAELACLLYRERGSYPEIENQLKIVSFQVLRGVYAGRHYPIIWYERDWGAVSDTFLYDEHLTSEIAAEVRQSLSQHSELGTIEKVFDDLGRAHEINALEAAVKAAVAKPHRPTIEIEIPKERYAEIHCVAVCFSLTGRLLAARRPATKRRFPNCLEFGCGQLRLDESFSDCLRRAYRDDFAEDLILSDPPIPVSSYVIRDEEEHRVIPGIIFIAEIANENRVTSDFSREKHSEILWLDPENLQVDPRKCVPNFQETVQLALKARRSHL